MSEQLLLGLTSNMGGTDASVGLQGTGLTPGSFGCQVKEVP